MSSSRQDRNAPSGELARDLRTRRGHRLLAAGLLLLALAAAPVAAEKTDRILVTNGTEIIGEVKSLEHGRLRVSTDYMGTVRMDWEQIAKVESELVFEVEVRDGQRHFGQLAASDEDRVLIVRGDDDTVRLPFSEVLIIHQTKTSRLGKIDAQISVGFSFNQGSDVTQGTFDGSVERRTKRFSSHLGLLAIVNDTGDQTFTRENLSYTILRHLRRATWTYDASATMQANEDLGLERRWLVRSSALRRVLRTDVRELSLGLGLAASSESYTGREPGETSLESTFSLRYAAFHFDDPELEVSVKFTLFPSLSSSGRVRLELRSDVRRELIDDLFWGLSIYESYDSDPVGEGAAHNDLVLTASLGWKY